MEFNSNLNNLFNNFQRQKELNENAGTKSKREILAEKNQLNKEKRALLDNKNLFDVNNDGKFDQKDIDMFVKGDVNGDGEVSQDEKDFINLYTDKMKNAFINAKANFEIDEERYVNGQKASGFVDGKLYRNGKLFTGNVNTGKYYVNGELANGKYNGYIYEDGVKYVENKLRDILEQLKKEAEEADAPKEMPVDLSARSQETTKKDGINLNTIHKEVDKNQLNLAQNLMSLMGATFDIADRIDNFKFKPNGTVIYESNGTKYTYSPDGTLQKEIKDKDGNVTELNVWNVNKKENPPKKELTYRIVNNHPDTSGLRISGGFLINATGDLLNVDAKGDFIKSVYVNADGTLSIS